ncbi:MAG: IS630 family transposase [Kiritimatiellae bacterium]|nr:IS630 family transposase [Kiritimatiellia bacterium]
MRPPKHRTPINLKALPRTKREVFRQQAFAAFKAGKKAYAVAKALNLNESCVGAWYAKFRGAGDSAVKERRRGPAPETKAFLTAEEVRLLLKAVTGTTPDQLMLDFALWSSRAVAAFVEKKFKKHICRRTARRYLQRLGFTYQCPIRRAREQNAAAADTWLNQTYPRIKADAARISAKILWADEATVQVGGIKPRGYARRGHPPILRTTGNRSVRCNTISAVGNRGDLMFMTFDGGMNVDTFKKFILQVIKEVGEPVTMIVDNLKVHHANCLTDWLKERGEEDSFTLEYLPSYSPKLNPDEYLNRDIKAGLAERSLPADSKAVTDAVVKHLTGRKRDPEKVRNLFKKAEVRYAAADELTGG